jgi:hypothetical protein
MLESMVLILVLNAGSFAAPAKPPTLPALPAQQEMTPEQQALADLTEQEQEETGKIQAQMNEQIKAVRRKYRQQRYDVMEKARPGSTTRLKQVAEIKDKFEDDTQALNNQQRAELQALPKPINAEDRNAIYKKYQTQRNAVLEEFKKRMQALSPAPPAEMLAPAPPAQKTIAVPKH